MHVRRPPSGDGPTIYRPNESVAMRLDPPPRPVAYEPESIPPPPGESLLMRVNRRRGQILTVMVSIAAIASFGLVVWWAHNQDVKAGGRGLEPLVVQAPTTPARVKPENAGGLIPPNQDKEVFNRIAPGATESKPEKLLSADNTISCATCHDPALAFTDGAVLGKGIAKVPLDRHRPRSRKSEPRRRFRRTRPALARHPSRQPCRRQRRP